MSLAVWIMVAVGAVAISLSLMTAGFLLDRAEKARARRMRVLLVPFRASELPEPEKLEQDLKAVGITPIMVKMAHNSSGGINTTWLIDRN